MRHNYSKPTTRQGDWKKSLVVSHFSREHFGKKYGGYFFRLYRFQLVTSWWPQWAARSLLLLGGWCVNELNVVWSVDECIPESLIVKRRERTPSSQNIRTTCLRFYWSCRAFLWYLAPFSGDLVSFMVLSQPSKCPHISNCSTNTLILK